MKYYKSLYILLPILFIVINLSFARYWQKAIPEVTSQDVQINIDSSIYKISGFGNQKLISSFMWLLTLIDSDSEHYKKRDLNSWIFLRIKNIIELDPTFYTAYKIGAQYLSIVKDDIFGAKYLIDKGLVHFSNRADFMYIAVFHYFNELKNRNLALRLAKECLKSCEQKYQFYFQKIIEKLSLKKDDLQTSYEILLGQYDSLNKNDPVQLKIYTKLYALKAEKDLGCLNNKTNKKLKCSTKDFDNRPYEFNNGYYRAEKKWKLFSN
ncbi:MAG: hypothetical protein H6622_02575 [Halobacteriovoraceae bacterium]|nr:hypothetical protein [Halobacteriovoraceae bacterium]